MIPLNPAMLKLAALGLAALVALTPIQEGKITDKAQTKIIEKAKQKRKELDNPNAPKKKLPIGIHENPRYDSPSPKGRTAVQNYQEAWTLLKKELGF